MTKRKTKIGLAEVVAEGLICLTLDKRFSLEEADMVHHTFALLAGAVSKVHELEQIVKELREELRVLRGEDKSNLRIAS